MTLPLITVLALLAAPAAAELRLGVTTRARTELDAKLEANPIRKIVTMLEDMQSELEVEAKNEKKLFEEAMCVCEKGKKSLAEVIREQTAESQRLLSKIEEDTAGKQKLISDVAAHKKDQADTEKSLAEATVLREKDHNTFDFDEKDMKFNLEGLDKAIPLFEQGGEGASFVQLPATYGEVQLRKFLSSTPFGTKQSRAQVVSFLDEQHGEGQPEMSAGVQEIVGILKGMRDSMSKELKDRTETELADAAAFEEMKDQQKKHIMLLKETVLDKDKRTGDLAVSLSQDKDAQEDADLEVENAQKYLESLTKQCEDRAADRDARAKMRNDEISAISEAIKILSDDDALDSFKQAQPGAAMMQTAYKPLAARSQYMKILDEIDQPAHKPAHKVLPKLMLLNTGAKSRRAHIEEAPQGGSAAEKVVHFLIDGMVKVLHDDDVSDEHKKAFCYNETDTHMQLQADKTVFQEALNQTITKQHDEITTLTEDVESLTKAIEDLDQEVAKASALRREEHETFVSNFRAMDTAIRLIDRAEVKLQEVYNPKAAAAKKKAVLDKARSEAGLAAFVQLHAHRGMAAVEPIELPDTPKTYEKKESGGVLDLMNTLRDEVKADLKESELEEKHSAADYTEHMKDAKKTRHDDAKSLNTKKSALADLSEKQQSDIETNELTLKELSAIKVYLRQLDVECDFIMKNYEFRHEARVGEEVGLEGAETIVTKEEPPTYEATEEVYEEEHSEKQVDEHFPKMPMPKLR